MNDLLGILREDGVWAIALAVGLPLALIVATELGFALARRRTSCDGLDAADAHLGAACHRRRHLSARRPGIARATTPGFASPKRPPGSRS